MNKIILSSRAFKAASIFMMFAYPIWSILLWTFTHSMPEWIISPHELQILDDPVENRIDRLWCWLSGLPSDISWVCMMYIFIKVLCSYMKMEILTLDNAIRYRKIGIAAFLFMIFEWVHGASINIIFKIHDSFIFNVLEECNFIYILGLLISSGVILVSWFMTEAYKIADEQTKII